MVSVSIILPTFNELKPDYLSKILEAYKDLEGIEIIAVDGGSEDGTLALLEQKAHKVLLAPGTSRAQRLNRGFNQAEGGMILFHHPRSVVEPRGVQALIQLASQPIWGGFTHHFDREHPLLEFTSWYSNSIRCDRRGILYLDHCIFFHRDLVPTQPVIPEIDIFEDTALSLKLKRHGLPLRLPYLSTTSAVRFLKNGIYQQAMMNQFLKVGYHCRVPHRLMNWVYEKGLELNSRVRGGDGL